VGHPVTHLSSKQDALYADRKLKHSMADKKVDLAGPGIGDYLELEKVLPTDYSSLLAPKETQRALFEVKRHIEDNLCKELNLMMVEVPLIVDEESGVNDLLDREGSRTRLRSTSPMITTGIPSTRRWYRQPRSGREWL